MSCKCGCHDDTPRAPATGWRRFVPLIVGAVVIGAIVVGILKKDGGKAASTGVDRVPTSTAARP